MALNVRYLLSQEKLDELTTLLENQRRDNQPVSRPYVPDPDPVGRSLYVALTPSDGIPARVGYNPGSNFCQIWQLIDDPNYDSLPSLVGLQFSEVVNNLCNTPIGANEWILIARDAYGPWWVMGPACQGSAAPPQGTETGVNQLFWWALIAPESASRTGTEAPGTGTRTGSSVPWLCIAFPGLLADSPAFTSHQLVSGVNLGLVDSCNWASDPISIGSGVDLTIALKYDHDDGAWKLNLSIPAEAPSTCQCPAIPKLLTLIIPGLIGQSYGGGNYSAVPLASGVTLTQSVECNWDGSFDAGNGVTMGLHLREPGDAAAAEGRGWILSIYPTGATHPETQYFLDPFNCDMAGSFIISPTPPSTTYYSGWPSTLSIPFTPRELNENNIAEYTLTEAEGSCDPTAVTVWDVIPNLTKYFTAWPVAPTITLGRCLPTGFSCGGLTNLSKIYCVSIANVTPDINLSGGINGWTIYQYHTLNGYFPLAHCNTYGIGGKGGHDAYQALAIDDPQDCVWFANVTINRTNPVDPTDHNPMTIAKTIGLIYRPSTVPSGGAYPDNNRWFFKLLNGFYVGPTGSDPTGTYVLYSVNLPIPHAGLTLTSAATLYGFCPLTLEVNECQGQEYGGTDLNTQHGTASYATASFNWTAPPGVKYVKVYAWGPGGDGAVGPNAVHNPGYRDAGGAGGGGGFTRALIAVTPSSIYSGTVGQSSSQTTGFMGDTQTIQAYSGVSGLSSTGGIGGTGSGTVITSHLYLVIDQLTTLTFTGGAGGNGDDGSGANRYAPGGGSAASWYGPGEAGQIGGTSIGGAGGIGLYGAGNGGFVSISDFFRNGFAPGGGGAGAGFGLLSGTPIPGVGAKGLVVLVW